MKHKKEAGEHEVETVIFDVCSMYDAWVVYF